MYAAFAAAEQLAARHKRLSFFDGGQPRIERSLCLRSRSGRGGLRATLLRLIEHGPGRRRCANRNTSRQQRTPAFDLSITHPYNLQPAAARSPGKRCCILRQQSH